MVPPFVGVAVNVIELLPHTDVVDALTLTDAVRTGLTVANTAVLLAVVQPLAVAST